MFDLQDNNSVLASWKRIFFQQCKTLSCLSCFFGQPTGSTAFFVRIRPEAIRTTVCGPGRLGRAGASESRPQKSGVCVATVRIPRRSTGVEGARTQWGTVGVPLARCRRPAGASRWGARRDRRDAFEGRNGCASGRAGPVPRERRRVSHARSGEATRDPHLVDRAGRRCRRGLSAAHRFCRWRGGMLGRTPVDSGVRFRSRRPT